MKYDTKSFKRRSFQDKPFSLNGKVLLPFLLPIQIASDLDKLILQPDWLKILAIGMYEWAPFSKRIWYMNGSTLKFSAAHPYPNQI